MAKVIISGYYGFNNSGDEAILAAMVTGLKQVLPYPEIVVLSVSPQQTATAYEVRAIKRTNVMALWKELQSAHLFISGGGSLLQDVTGLTTIPFYGGQMALARLAKVPVFVFSQGIGPIKGRLGRAMVSYVMGSADGLTVRDRESVELLQMFGIKRSVQQTADPVMYLQPASPIEVKEVVVAEKIPYNEKGPWIGVSLRPWNNDEQLGRNMAKALDQLIETHGVQVVFVPLHFGVDREIIEKTRIRMNHFESTHVIENEYSPQIIMGLMSMFDVVVGMRLHSLIFAVAQGVVPVGISYDPKIDAFLAQLDMKPAAYADNVDPEGLVTAVIGGLELTANELEAFRVKTDSLRQAAWKAVKYALELVVDNKYVR